MEKIGMVSLGCPKNRVDAEIMLNKLQNAGYEICPNESDADAIIINTCGFIEDAKTESIENILEVAKYKKDGKLKSLIVTGCLAERYRDEIKELLPEVDVVVGLAGNDSIVDIVKRSLKGENTNIYGKKENLSIEGDRLLSTPSYTAYVKIAEGCDNCCTYCAIPKIRGRFRSRKKENILSEIKKLTERGVKEIILVAQDTTKYGVDIYGKPKLAELMSDICKIEGVKWLRVLYTYPDLIDNDLLDTFSKEEKIVNYFDIPLQHCDEKVLQRMNRGGNKEWLLSLMNKIREKLPDVTLRTTLITGFPGETEEQFSNLCEFVKQVKFDHLGCFPYSEEEGTAAAKFTDQIDQQTRVDRSEIIMNDQLGIVEEHNKEKYGKTTEVLIEGYDDYIKCYYGRARWDAPEIDGKIFFMTTHSLVIGDFVNVKINDSLDYDLLGEICE